MEDTNNSTIQQKLEYLDETKSMIKQAIIDKGQEITTETPFREYVQKIKDIETGVDTSDADATISDLAQDKTAYVNGQKIVGNLFEIKGGQLGGIDANITADGDNISGYVRSPYDIILRNNDTDQSSLGFILDGPTYAPNLGIVPEKIIEGESILGVNGIAKTSEDLQEQLDAQDAIIEQLKEALNNKTAGNGGDTATCIYLQNETPTDKNGIWINTDKTYENIYIENEKYTNKYSFMYSSVNDEIDDSNLIQKIRLPQSFYGSTYCQSGNVIHMFGYYYSNDNLSKMLSHYKYDYDTNEWTKLADCPTPQGDGGAVWIGDYIYIFGTSHPDYRKYAYKYDTLNDSWERLADITTTNTVNTNGFTSASSYKISACYNIDTPDYIYLACGAIVVTYNILEQSYVDITNKLSSILGSYFNNFRITTSINREIFDFYNGKLLLSTYISSSSQYLFLVDLANNSYKTLTKSIPAHNYQPCQYLCDNKVFILSDIRDYTQSCIYDINTNTFYYIDETNEGKLKGAISYPHMKITTSQGVVSAIFKNYNDENGTAGIKLEEKSYDFDNNTLVIYSPASGDVGQYKTALFKNSKILNDGKLITCINDVALYDTTENQLLKNLNTYYGNGTDWIKIK